jgi:HAD superfamily hydrolase (TIGR01450 family)
VHLLPQAKGFLLDLDGVIWIGENIAPGALDFWRYCQQASIPVTFVSNTATKSRAMIREKLHDMGLTGVVDEQVFPATRAAALYIAAHQDRARVFVIGERGTFEELEAVGAEIVEHGADFVMVGADRHITFDRLERATQEVLAGARLVAANGDGNYPTERGISPAAGAFKAFLEAASKQQAVNVGKPETELLHQAVKYVGIEPHEAVMVGDTVEADLVAARRLGTQAVFIGEANSHPLLHELKPEIICRDLGELLKLIQIKASANLPETY